MPTYLRFEFGQEDHISPVYGPFPFVQLTYELLRVGPDGEELAYFEDANNCWRVRDSAEVYTDVIIYDQEL
jgi:hypothetical protein